MSRYVEWLLCTIVVLLLAQSATGAYLIFRLNSLEERISGLPVTGAAVQQNPSPKEAPTQYVDVSPGNGPSRGPMDAQVVIVEFTDFECPFCAKAHETVLSLLNKYKTQVRLVSRDYPLSNLHANAVPAASAARCAGDQGAYWEYYDTLFARASKEQGSALCRDKLIQYASELKLDSRTFENCLESGKHLEEINSDFVAGQQYGVTGTPTFFINGRMVVGAKPLSEFISIVDEELAKRR
jgi:protein-disulfide isomerase